MKLLVTGAAGFVGRHLLAAFRSEHPEAEIYGVVRPRDDSELAFGATRIEADLEDPKAVAAIFDAVVPDRIIHLAAQSSPQDSWRDPAGTLRTNLFGLLHLLEAVCQRRLAPRVLVVGSAEEYGAAPGGAPVSEDTPLAPASPYAVSKVAQGFLALQYALSHRMGIVRTRTFHHTGPGRGAGFAESSFARQIAEIEAGLREGVLSVGNLDAVRDFSDVRDVARAYALLLEQGVSGEVYNVCSGRGLSMRELLQMLLKVAGVEVELRVDAQRLRPADVPVLVGDPRKLAAATGWQPRIPLEQTLKDLLEDWRGRVRGALPRAEARA